MIRQMTDTATGEVYAVGDHQQEAYDHVVTRNRAALFLGMSLNKTVTMLSAIYDMEYREGAFFKTLVIAPDKVAKFTWSGERARWAHLRDLRISVVQGDARQRLRVLGQKADIYTIGVGCLPWLIDQYLQKRGGKWVGRLPFDCVVIDESTLFKNWRSQRFKKLRRAMQGVDYRYILTGTPSPQGLTDLWAQMYLLDEGERLGTTFGQFIDKFFTTRGNGQIVYEYIPRPLAAEVIAAKLKDIALTMQTRDRVKLPALHVVDEEITLSEKDRATYDRLEREYVLDFFEGDGGSTTVSAASDLTMKLLQITSGAVYEDAQYEERTGRALPRVWHEVNTAKMEALRRLFATYPDENFICVYQFRHEVARIKAAFPHARELRKSEDFMDWNAGKIKLLLIHPASAGHGLNLQFGGHRMVWTTLTYNLEHWLQTVARLVRSGQVHEIYAHRLIVPGTRDGHCAARVESKESNQKYLMDEIKDLRQKYYGTIRQ